MEEQKIGIVEKYFKSLKVAVVVLNDTLRPGEKLHIRGKSDFEQVVGSIQINGKQTKKAFCGDKIGLAVEKECFFGDEVFRVFE